MTRFSTWFQKLYDVPGDPGGGGGAPASGAPAGTPAPPPNGAPSATPAAGPGGAPAAGAAPGEARPTFAYPEDRSKWLPPHRYQEVSGRVQTLEQQLHNQQARIRALMGVAEPEDPRMAEVRDSLRKVAPGLIPLLDRPDLAEKLAQFMDRDYPELTGGNEARSHELAFATSTAAVEAYAKAVGVDANTLPASRVNWMARQLGSFIAADPSGDREHRYNMRDPSIITELIAEMTGFIVAPKIAAASTGAAAQVERARQLPSAGPRGGMPPPAGSASAPKDKKSIHEAARQALLAGTGQ